jgi:ribonuclease J
MSKKKNLLRVIPLGGLDEIGKNMTVIEFGNDMIVVDAGIMFPDDDHPGIDLILPDYSYIVKRKEKLRGIVITHGHEDHTGALPYLLKELGGNVPVLGTKLTLGLIKNKLEEHKIKKPKLREIRAGGHVTLGVFGLDFFAVNHSIPDGVGIFIRTPVGNVLHTGDFKLDQTPIDGRLTDFGALAKFGKQGVMLLHVGLHQRRDERHHALRGRGGQGLRSHHRRCRAARDRGLVRKPHPPAPAGVRCRGQSGRKVVVTGRSMINNTKVARELGYLHIDEETSSTPSRPTTFPPRRSSSCAPEARVNLSRRWHAWRTASTAP